MNLRDQLESLHRNVQAGIASRCNPTSSTTVPDQIAFLRGVEAAVATPNALVDAQARATQLQAQVSELENGLAVANAKVATAEKNIDAIVEQRLGAKATEMSAMKSEIEALRASDRSAEMRAIEIAAANGHRMPVAADQNKDAGKGGTDSTQLT